MRNSMQSIKLAVTTDADGNADVTSEMVATGRVLQVRYTPDGSAALATGADIAITGKQSGIEVLTKANIGTSAFTAAPRQPTHKSTDGAAKLYASGGEPVSDFVYLYGERLRLVVAEGGDTKSGTFEILVG